ncbi:MAG: universal stress protein [Actinomycetota bacterium]
MNETIVVGVDGSMAARLAVRWAAREAELRKADLILVSAWSILLDGFSLGDVAVTEDLLKGLEIDAEQRLAEAANDARAVATDISITTEAVEGNPSAVLLHAARDADLLVIGSRGLGGFRGLLLGSVSQQCADHASCPVVVVRHVDGDTP